MAWSLATGAAVTLSWWGVHTVMSGTVYDRPSAVPLTATGDSPAAPRPEPQASSTQRPRPSTSPSTRPPAASSTAPRPTAPSGPADRSRTATPPPSPVPSAAGTSTGSVKSYVVDGGRVVFDMGDTSAELVSATPASGWQMQVWKQDTWIRVTFTRDDREISVFCVWHDTAPRVEIDDRRT